VTALPDRQFFKIGEAAEIVGVKTHVLRYWETEFPSIKPLKTRGAHRMYRRADVELLCVIHKLLHHEGYTIAGARKRVRELRGELRRAEQVTPSTQAAGEPAASAPSDPGVSAARQAFACEPAAPETTREFSVLNEAAVPPGVLHDAASGLGVLNEAAVPPGVLHDAASGLGLLQGDARELGLWKEASRELGLRAELIQLRRELSDLMHVLDQLASAKPVATQASATVTAVVPKTVLISQRKQLR
jgi:DNA-binding transcriptional MerR regulator